MLRSLNRSVVICLLLFSSIFLQAQESRPISQGWYVGAQVGMPMSEGNFSSFGVDGFRPGWNVGLHAGYRFTRVWSAELTANWGQQFLAEQDCCYERDYVLGADMKRYRYGIPTGINTYLYKDLLSRTFVQRYGLQVNFNVLGLFKRTRDCRWRLEFAPTMYAANTNSNLILKADKALVIKDLNKWHFCYGGNGLLSYSLSTNLNLAFYGGFTHLMGRALDGIPELHSTNYIVDAGLKLNYLFSSKKRPL